MVAEAGHGGARVSRSHREPGTQQQVVGRGPEGQPRVEELQPLPVALAVAAREPPGQAQVQGRLPQGVVRSRPLQVAVLGRDRPDVPRRQEPPALDHGRRHGVTTRGGLFVGTAGGRLLALDMNTGIVGWDATVANPKGATELERIADVTSLPIVDGQQVCAVAYQGRVACFEITRGTLNWSRDVSSLYGLAGDGKNIYVTDDKGSVQALDRSTGASVWKQDRLAERKIGGPQMIGTEFVAVIDVEGYVHLLATSNGAYVGRLQTDGSPATSQPALFLSSILWQSANGTLYAVTAK